MCEVCKTQFEIQKCISCITIYKGGHLFIAKYNDTFCKISPWNLTGLMYAFTS